jgi:hypothetical protein
MRGKWLWAALGIVIVVAILAFSAENAGKRVPDTTRKPPLAGEMLPPGPSPSTAPVGGPSR